ncbi:hypothetical protein PR048_019645 [Dryococelus australis]|uniref:Uncharacterized protein n=1 Tax=Dryococelus australis TaxID=614101 RepID=A0ABQ9H450_9NEOP|nr:hypothetical protein PR048_019645 [Dryococelus australis]
MAAWLGRWKVPPQQRWPVITPADRFAVGGLPPFRSALSVGTPSLPHRRISSAFVSPCDRPVQWSAQSPDLNPVDFFLWDYPKAAVFRDIPTTPENMQECTVCACNTLQQATLKESVLSFIHRLNWCIVAIGHHFEHPMDHSGGAVRLLTSHQGDPGSIPVRVSGFSHVGIVPVNAISLLVFSRISTFPHSFIPAPLHTSITLTSSQKLAVERCPNLFTHCSPFPTIHGAPSLEAPPASTQPFSAALRHVHHSRQLLPDFATRPMPSNPLSRPRSRSCLSPHPYGATSTSPLPWGIMELTYDCPSAHVQLNESTSHTIAPSAFAELASIQSRPTCTYVGWTAGTKTQSTSISSQQFIPHTAWGHNHVFCQQVLPGKGGKGILGLPGIQTTCRHHPQELAAVLSTSWGRALLDTMLYFGREEGPFVKLPPEGTEKHTPRQKWLRHPVFHQTLRNSLRLVQPPLYPSQLLFDISITHSSYFLILLCDPSRATCCATHALKASLLPGGRQRKHLAAAASQLTHTLSDQLPTTHTVVYNMAQVLLRQTDEGAPTRKCSGVRASNSYGSDDKEHKGLEFSTTDISAKRVIIFSNLPPIGHQMKCSWWVEMPNNVEFIVLDELPSSVINNTLVLTMPNDLASIQYPKLPQDEGMYCLESCMEVLVLEMSRN